MGDTSVFFDACIKRIEEEIIPLVQTFPPKITKDSDGILSASVDLLLFRNLLFSLEFCFHETDSRLSDEQLCKIQSIVRKQIIPSYLEFFRNNFLLENGQSSSFFYVRQENNSSWAKLIWGKMKEIYLEKEREKPEDSHELGVPMPSGVLDVLARLLELFFPTEEVNQKSVQSVDPKKFSTRIERKFSMRMFELLNFDLRRDAPEVLESLLQRALIDRYDALMPKNAFYIINRIVSFSREAVSDYQSTAISNDNVFCFSKDSKNAILWEQFIVAYGSVQESQIHLVRPLLPVIREIQKEMASGWWRVLLQKGLFNDSIPIRRLVLHSILTSTQPEIMGVICSPEGLDFCLEDLLVIGLDANSSFLVSPQQIYDGEIGPVVDLGEAVSTFFGQVIQNFIQKSESHGRAIVREILISLEKMVRAPVALIYILKAFSQVPPFAAIEDADLGTIQRIAGLATLHNQRARLLVKNQLTDVLISFSSPADISFAQLSNTLCELLNESLSLGELNIKCKEFPRLSSWLDNTFGVNFLKENLTISIERFYRLDGSRENALVLALMAVFSLGSGDGRFVSYSRPVFEQLALVHSLERIQDAVNGFTLFLALNDTVGAVLLGEEDLIVQLHLTGRIFDWLDFIDSTLFGEEMCMKVDFSSANILLESLSLLIERANENDEKQLMQFLDIHVFSLINFVNNRNNDPSEEIDFGFKRLMTVLAAYTALSSILNKLRVLDHLQPDIITHECIQKTIRFKLERPGGLSEAEWDQWPEFVTAFTASKWKCVESMSQCLLTSSNPREELLGILAACLQALEVSKYGGTLSILKCMSTLFDSIFNLISADADNREDNQFCALMALSVQIFKNILKGGSETQRWFDAYAEAFIDLFFRPSALKASQSSSLILESIREVFDFILKEIGPKRRGIVALVSSRLGEYWIGSPEALSENWRSELIQLLIYGPIRGSTEESVAARINQVHVPDNDYQVRVHGISVLNHLEDHELIQDFLVDLLGQQESSGRASSRKKMFPGDFGHRVKLRSWSVILALIGILCTRPGALSVEFVESSLLETLWRLVGEETMSSTRIFIEWSLSRLYLKFSSLIESDFMATRVLYRDVSASLVISMLAVALNVAKKLRAIDESVALTVFFPIMSDSVLPLLAHNNHTVRMHAIHAFKSLEKFKSLYKIESNVLGYKLLYGFIENAEHCQKFIKKIDDDVFLAVDGLDPIEDLTLDWIFSKLMRLGGVEGEAIEFYSFMNYREIAGAIPFGDNASVDLELSVDSCPSNSPIVSSGPVNTVAKEVTDLFKDFQTKIDIYSPFTRDELEDGNCSRPVSPGALVSAVLSDKTAELGTEIVVIGSLLDKLPNLAGLARTSEIFGVQTLYVPNLAALASPDFLNVAMTAEKWLDIRQLAPGDISHFLETMKRENGFTIVALEQTSNSIPLQSFSFPKKTCIVLGNERCGIPAEILHLVDDCVEIPQFGRVRSLNVHVSGSLAIWKAREQDLI